MAPRAIFIIIVSSRFSIMDEEEAKYKKRQKKQSLETCVLVNNK